MNEEEEEEKRVYQYRVWDTLDHTWVDPDLICLFPNGSLFAVLRDEIWEVEQERFITELATGEQDSKERMIYEGDILYAETWTTNHMGNKVLSYLTYIEVRFPHFWRDVLEWLSGESYTILGNIHENPDLLEKVKGRRDE